VGKPPMEEFLGKATDADFPAAVKIVPDIVDYALR